MSTAANSYYFRRRTMGRAASPPTWACYEQIHRGGASDDSDSNSDSDSCSEDDEDYPHSGGAVGHGAPVARARGSDSEDNKHEMASPHAHIAADAQKNADDGHDIDMDIDEEGDGNKKKDIKGKQRAIDPEPELPTPTTPRRQRKKRPHVYTLRPILTIQRSQGFVWNQDLFVPPYIKDRYIASTSPPNSRGFISSSVGSNNSAITDYEVEVVEIRVNPGDLDDIIP